jgi:hypothetical protein
MARARLLKPGFFTNEQLTEVHPFGRLLFAGLWTLADREGRMPNRPKWIKGALFPYENVPVEKLLAELEALGFLYRYEVKGERYIQILNFLKHQHPHVKEPPSTIPAPYQHHADPVHEHAFSGTSPAESESVTEAESESVPETESVGPTPGKALDRVAADFASFGKVTAGTARAIEYSVQDFGLDWVQRAVKQASGGAFDDRPPWSYVESILERWKAQGGPDERIHTNRRPAGNGARNGAGRRRDDVVDDDGIADWQAYAEGRVD